MMLIQLLDPNYLWAPLLAPVIFIGWTAAEILRLRRMRRFGDPEVIGVRPRTASRAVAALLYAAGFGATAGILSIPVGDRRADEALAPLVEILLDSRLSDSHSPDAAYLLDDVEDQVRAAIRMAPRAEFALYRSGEPLDVVSPPTPDGEGVRILMSDLRQGWRIDSSASLEQSVSLIARRKPPGRDRPRRILVITERPRGDFLDLYEALQGTSPKVLLLCMGTRGRGDDSGSQRKGTPWIWLDQAQEVQEFLREENSRLPASHGWLQGLGYVRALAAAGLIALLSERLWAAGLGYQVS